MAVTLFSAGGRATSGTRVAHAATISTGLLLPQDRIARAPLVPWAGSLMSQLAESRRSFRVVDVFTGTISVIANNAALIAAHEGDGATAWKLCERQMRWHASMSRRARRPALAVRGIQAWINLGRLEALTGDWRAPLNRFARLVDYRASGLLDLDGIHLNGTAWQAVAGTRKEFEEFLENVYVIDSLKALLLNRRFAEVVDFASALHLDGRPDLARRAQEALLISACKLGDFDRAQEIAHGALLEARAWDRVVFKLRLAETLACAGDRDGAEAVLLPVIEVVRKISAERKSELQTLYVLLRLSSACRELGLEEEARALAHDVHDGGGRADDQVFQIEALRILASLSHPDRTGWHSRLSELEGATDYERYRRGHRPPGARDPALDRLYGELCATFAG